MTRQEKMDIGTSKAFYLIKELQDSGKLKGMTHFTIRNAMSGTRWCQYTLKLYSENRPKYKKNPLLKVDFGYRNIINMTEADVIKGILSNTLTYGIPQTKVDDVPVDTVDGIPF